MYRVFSLENTKTGAYRTFRLRKQSETSSFAPGLIVLSLLIGRSDWKGLAFYNEVSMSMKVWRCHHGTDLERMALMVGSILSTPEEGNSHGYFLIDALPCRACGELLTRPDSIRLGVGPVCAGK